MIQVVAYFLKIVGIFFILYLAFYATYLFLSVSVGAWRLYTQDKMRQMKNVLKHPFYFPVSILVPAYNEEVTIIDSIESLLDLDYKLYEIIIINDGSTDNTDKYLIDHFKMDKVDRPIRLKIKCNNAIDIYEKTVSNIKITLINKENGGKSDALNMGINASEFPYFLCVDADSMLQRDSLEQIAQPLLEEKNVIAVGGLIRVAQCVEMENGIVKKYRLPKWNLFTSMQVMEYDRSFLASRLLLDTYNGNLIISGAFGLFNKEYVMSVGGYDPTTVGEDMELVTKLHVFCRNNMIDYSIKYAPNAICLSQVPGSPGDLARQRRRWHIGLYQSLKKYKSMLFKQRFGLLGTVTYLYFLLYELYSPVIELFGIGTIVLSWFVGLLNVRFMINIFLLYAIYGAILSITAFFQRIYTQNLEITFVDGVKACFICLFENIFFRFFMDIVRGSALIGISKGNRKWGRQTRKKQNRVQT